MAWPEFVKKLSVTPPGQFKTLSVRQRRSKNLEKILLKYKKKIQVSKFQKTKNKKGKTSNDCV